MPNVHIPKGPIPSPLPCRYIQAVATEAQVIATWESKDRTCRDAHGENFGYHRYVKSMQRIEEANVSHRAFDVPFPHKRLPDIVCMRCGQSPSAEEKVDQSLSYARIYDTESGLPEPGDIYLMDWTDCKEDGECMYGWSNCDGIHYAAILPTGEEWHMDQRARNCTLPHDTTHRCWVRVGEPPNLHVSKSGHTCAAGAGSIATPRWHGFLQHGKFVG